MELSLGKISKKARSLTGLLADRKLAFLTDRIIELDYDELMSMSAKLYSTRRDSEEYDDLLQESDNYRRFYRVRYVNLSGGLAYKFASDEARERFDAALGRIKFVLNLDQPDNYCLYDGFYVDSDGLHAHRKNLFVKGGSDLN